MGMTSKEYHEGYQQGFKDAKADYENRLKADMVAMLTEIQTEIEKEAFDMANLVYIPNTDNANVILMDDLNKIIQQKIKLLKEKNNEL